MVFYKKNTNIVVLYKTSTNIYGVMCYFLPQAPPIGAPSQPIPSTQSPSPQFPAHPPNPRCWPSPVSGASRGRHPERLELARHGSPPVGTPSGAPSPQASQAQSAGGRIRRRAGMTGWRSGGRVGGLLPEELLRATSWTSSPTCLHPVCPRPSAPGYRVRVWY
jgi:hypothetical protein